MYTPLQSLTHGSPLLSQTTPEDLAKFAKEQGYPSIGLSDFDNLFMCVQYHDSFIKEGLKPILGFQLKVFGGEEHSYISVYAKNLAGWQRLLEILYRSNNPETYKGGPRLEVYDFINLINDDIVVIIKNGFVDIFERHAPNVFLGIDPILYSPEEIDELRKSPLKRVAITPNHYLTRSDWTINQYLLCNYLKGNLNTVTHPILDSNQYYILSKQELLDYGITQEEINTTQEIYESVESFEIKSKQELPQFDCPNGMDQDEYLRHLCREGFKRLGLPKTDEYIDRIKMELDVIASAGIAGYFIIMQDIIGWAEKADILVGTGRGSAGGCIVSYLTGITKVDPVRYNLLFERFYSAERKDLPDIDSDFPPSRREEIVQYIQNKYGEDRFAQLSTFNTLKGAASLKAVLRAKGVDVQEQNYITKKIPEEGKVAPELAAQKNEYGTDSLLFWCIHNMDEFKQWCSPTYEGIYGEEFKAAIELDKIISGRGRHASAFALANKKIYHKAPLIWDESAQRHVVGVNMEDAEKLGLVKLDLLGLDLLDKADYIRKTMKNGVF